MCLTHASECRWSTVCCVAGLLVGVALVLRRTSFYLCWSSLSLFSSLSLRLFFLSPSSPSPAPSLSSLLPIISPLCAFFVFFAFSFFYVFFFFFLFISHALSTSLSISFSLGQFFTWTQHATSHVFTLCIHTENEMSTQYHMFTVSGTVSILVSKTTVFSLSPTPWTVFGLAPTASHQVVEEGEEGGGSCWPSSLSPFGAQKISF